MQMSEDGFTTSKRWFVNSDEAYRIAKAANQLLHPEDTKTRLDIDDIT